VTHLCTHSYGLLTVTNSDGTTGGRRGISCCTHDHVAASDISRGRLGRRRSSVLGRGLWHVSRLRWLWLWGLWHVNGLRRLWWLRWCSGLGLFNWVTEARALARHLTHAANGREHQLEAIILGWRHGHGVAERQILNLAVVEARHADAWWQPRVCCSLKLQHHRHAEP
jgi:hypothetical protein